MPDRVDVPALLRRAGNACVEAQASCECYAREQPCNGCEEADSDRVFLDRLAGAVEDWQRDPDVGRVTDLMVALKASLAGPRVLALLRGEGSI